MDRPRDDRATAGKQPDGIDTLDPPADDAADDTADGSHVAMHASRRGFMSLLGISAVSTAAMSRSALADEGGYGTGEYGTGGYGGTGGADTPDGDDETGDDDDAAHDTDDGIDEGETGDDVADETDDSDDGDDETDDDGDAEESSLSIDTFDLVEVGSSGSDTEFQLTWSVSAPDESLKHVLIVISDLRRLVQWELVPVSGSTAEGTETVRIRDREEQSLSATIAVADAAGNRRTQSTD